MAGRGRPTATGTSRGDVVCFRLSEEEKQRLNRARGTTSRSDFVRQAVKDAIDRSET